MDSKVEQLYEIESEKTLNILSGYPYISAFLIKLEKEIKRYFSSDIVLSLKYDSECDDFVVKIKNCELTSDEYVETINRFDNEFYLENCCDRVCVI